MFMQDAARFIADPAQPAVAPNRTGLLSATLVETETGWRPAGDLRRGDRVHTFDGGLRPLVAMDRDWLDAGTDLIRLPGGVLGNAADQMLLPGQHLMIDTWDMAEVIDAPVALIPAEALAGLGGSARSLTGRPAEVVIPVFQTDEVIYANGGLLMHCPGIATGPHGAPDDGYFARLGVAQARAVMRDRLATEPAPNGAAIARRSWLRR